MSASYISESTDKMFRIEGIRNKVDLKKWFTGYIVINNETTADFKVWVSTTENYQINSETVTSGQAEIAMTSVSSGGSRHLINKNAKEEILEYYIGSGDRQDISLCDSRAYLIIMARNPNSPGAWFVVTPKASVNKGRRYFINQSDFDLALRNNTP